MKTLLKLIAPLIFLTSLFFPAFAFAEGSQKEVEEIRKLVDSFCQTEFNGGFDPDFEDLVIYSPEYSKNDKLEWGEKYHEMRDWYSVPFYVIDAYQLVDINILHGKATAKIIYRRLARSRYLREINPDYKERDVVNLILVRDNNNWLVLDPPFPKISKTALLRIQKDEMEQVENLLNKPRFKMDEGLKRGYDHNLKKYMEIQVLKAEPNETSLMARDPYQLVESFCKAEFEGDPNDVRLDLVKFSDNEPDDKHWIRKWEMAPLKLVGSYRVLKVDVNGDSGTAVVSYKRLGRAAKQDTGIYLLTADYEAEDVVTLNMRREGGRWWIVDPPPPNISNPLWQNTTKKPFSPMAKTHLRL